MSGHTEFEVRLYDVNHDEIRGLLESLGAVCTHAMRLQKRVLYDASNEYTEHQFFRLRNEGNRTTFTCKEFHNTTQIDGTQEWEVAVSDFDVMRTILEKMGCTPRSYQETYRETRQLGDVEIALDLWPGLQPIAEVEGPHEQSVRDVVLQLGYDRSDVWFGNVVALYKEKLGYTDQQVTHGMLVF